MLSRVGCRRLISGLKTQNAKSVQALIFNYSRQLSSTELPKTDHNGYKLFYKLKPINVIKLLSRLKIYQTAFFVTATPIAYLCAVNEMMSLLEANVIAGAGTLATLTLAYISYVTRRLVGLVWLNEQTKEVKIAYLTFWAERRDVVLPLDSINLFDNPSVNYLKPLLRVTMKDSDNFYFLSLRWGSVFDRKMFRKVFGKMPLDQLDAAAK